MTESSFHLIINKYKMMIALFLIICMNDCIIFMGCMRCSSIMTPLPSTVHDSQFVHGAKRLLHLIKIGRASCRERVYIYVVDVIYMKNDVSVLSVRIEVA